MYDAVFLASDELMRKQEGRKAIILLTDGVDEGSKVSLDRAIETAQRANTLVYSILYADPDAYGHQGYGGPAEWAVTADGAAGGMGRYPGGGGTAADIRSRVASRRQEGSATHFERDRRAFLRSLQEAADQRDLYPDRRRAAQSVQPGLHAGQSRRHARATTRSP